MPNYRQIYAESATEYDRLVAHEDYQGNIIKALGTIRPLAGTTVVEFGAGTGRLSRLLAPIVRWIYLFDSSSHMLGEARQRFADTGWSNWAAAVADNRAMPVRPHSADIAIAGWSLGHLTGWFPDQWRYEIGRAIHEMMRLARPGGTIIILETLGTGRETPRPPTEALGNYYRVLEEEYRFSSTWIRTDYRFDSLTEAKTLLGFFFGDGLVSSLSGADLPIVPECTGIWWATQ